MNILIFFVALIASFMVIIVYVIPKMKAWRYKKKMDKVKEIIRCDFLIVYDNGMKYERKKSGSQVWDFSLLDKGIVGLGLSGLNDLIDTEELRKDGAMIFSNSIIYKIETKEGEEFIWEKLYLP